MRRRTLITTVGAILGTSVGAAAYTSASLSRSTSFTIAADSGGARIGLVAGTSSGVSGEIVDGTNQLDISLENLNTGSTFTYGDSANLATQYAFQIVNNDSNAGYDITATYDQPEVTFDFYTPDTSSGSDDWSAATKGGTTSGGTASSTISLAAGGTAGDKIHVVMTVVTDTTAPANGVLTIDSTPTTV